MLSSTSPDTTLPTPPDGGGPSVAPYLAAVQDLADRVTASDLARQVAADRRADLIQLSLTTDDERFRAGLAWAVAGLDRVTAALDGETDPSHLRFRSLSRPR